MEKDGVCVQSQGSTDGIRPVLIVKAFWTLMQDFLCMGAKDDTQCFVIDYFSVTGYPDVCLVIDYNYLFSMY